MLKNMEKEYEWPGMKEEIENYVEGCQECPRNKPDRTKQ